MVLLVFKERLKAFYGRFYNFINPVIKFCLSYTIFLTLNSNIGYMAKLKNPLIGVGLAAVCAFLPYGAITFIAAGFMLAHIYSVSIEISLIVLIFFILIALLYYGFQPGDSYWLLLTPLAFLLKIPYVIPLLAGLSGSLVAVVPVCCGVLVYFVFQYVKQNAGVLTNDASVDITQKYAQIIKALTSNELMLVMLVTLAIGILTVFLIRCLSIDYAWILAITIGIVAQLAVVFVGYYMFDVTISVVELLLGILAAGLIAGIYHFFVFAVDYSRTEYTQFEDDDYVYYVKAVPKLTVSTPDVKVQRINNPPHSYRSAKQ